MDRFRIKKDRVFRWPITTNNAELPLEGRDLRLEIIDPRGRRKVHEFKIVESNKIEFRFKGVDQEMVGVYSLTLWEYYEDMGSTATDYCNAFEIVPTTCEEKDVMDGLDREVTVLGESNIEVGFHGASAYEIAVDNGYQGSESDWVKSLHTVSFRLSSDVGCVQVDEYGKAIGGLSVETTPEAWRGDERLTLKSAYMVSKPGYHVAISGGRIIVKIDDGVSVGSNGHAEEFNISVTAEDADGKRYNRQIPYQIIGSKQGLHGESAYDMWKKDPGNQDKTYADFEEWQREEAKKAAESVTNTEKKITEEENKRVANETIRQANESNRKQAAIAQNAKEKERIAAEQLREEKMNVQLATMQEKDAYYFQKEKERNAAELARADEHKRMKTDSEAATLAANNAAEDSGRRTAEAINKAETAAGHANTAATTIDEKINPIIENDKNQDEKLAALDLEDDKNAKVIAKALVEHEENIALVRKHLIGLLSQWTGIKDDIQKEAESMLGAPELIAKVTAQALLELMSYVENLRSVVLGVFGGDTTFEVLKAQNIKYRGCDLCLYGTTAPGKAPEFIGQHFVDTVGKVAYIAVGTERVDNWVAINVK